MISLAGRDILHAWAKFVFTGIGLGLLIGVTLVMAGVYRGMVDDGKALLDNSGADLWVVQQGTLGPYAESSSVNDDMYRTLSAMQGVEEASNITYLTMQVRKGESDVRAIMAAQLPRAERIARADDVISNEGDRDALREQVRPLHQRCLARAAEAREGQ